jgi:hypothetical protein
MGRDFRIRRRTPQSTQIAFDSRFIVIELLHLRKAVFMPFCRLGSEVRMSRRRNATSEP